jgi:hypothetical protein
MSLKSLTVSNSFPLRLSLLWTFLLRRFKNIHESLDEVQNKESSDIIPSPKTFEGELPIDGYFNWNTRRVGLFCI